MRGKMFDLAVIGAGIIGVMTAYLAQQEAEWRILLLDRSMVGDGASKYSAGLDLPYGRSARQKSLSALSSRIYLKLKTAMPDLPVSNLPLFGITGKDRMNEVVEGFIPNTVRIGEARDVERLRECFDDLAISDEQVLLAGVDCSFARVDLVASIVLDHLKRAGMVECWEGAEVRGVRKNNGVFSLEVADGREVLTRRVLLATGPWLLRGPGRDAAREAGVRIKKIVSLHVDRCPGPDDPVLFLFDEDAFLLPLYDRREWLFSFTSQEWDCEPEISRLSISREDRETALAILARYCPSFVERCHGGRVFCDAYSPDRAPMIQAIPGMANYVIAGACSGSGYRLAPAIAYESLKQFS